MRWTIKPKPEEHQIKALATELKVEYLVAQLLIQRGITTYEEAKKFFRPQLSDLHDPFLMKDMYAAVERIEMAIANNENILVFGDYDVDGTTSVALVSSYLTQEYPNVATYIPDRYNEGYGVSYQGIDFAEDNGFSLIIALDCGVKAIEKVAYAKEKGIDFIICDHHRPGEFLPQAIAVLDPKREDCDYPYDELCGCGVGFTMVGPHRLDQTDDHWQTKTLSRHIRCVVLQRATIVQILFETVNQPFLQVTHRIAFDPTKNAPIYFSLAACNFMHATLCTQLSAFSCLH